MKEENKRLKEVNKYLNQQVKILKEDHTKINGEIKRLSEENKRFNTTCIILQLTTKQFQLDSSIHNCHFNQIHHQFGHHSNGQK